MQYFRKLPKDLLKAVISLWEVETKDRVGRLNLLGGFVISLLVFVAFIALAVPNFILQLLRMFFDKPVPPIGYIIPLGGIFLLVFYFLVSVKLIAPSPPK